MPQTFPLVVDGIFNVPYQVTPPKFSQPFDGDAGAYVMEIDYWIHENYFAPIPLNTPHETVNNDPALSHPTYYLVKESPTTKVGNGIVSWTRTYAQVPQSRNDYTTIVARFPGYAGTIYPAIGNSTVNPGRVVGNYTVRCRTQSDYFITENNVPSQLGGFIGTGASVANLPQPIYGTSYGRSILLDPSFIPYVPKTRFYVPVGTWSGGTFTPTYTDPVQAALQGAQVDSIWDSTGPYAGSPASVPSLTLYRTWIDQGLEIVAEDSKISRWMGNIYVRQILYVKAQ